MSRRSRRFLGAASARHWPVRGYLMIIAAISLAALVAGSWYGFSWASAHARSAALSEMSFQSDRAAESLSEGIAQGKSSVADLAGQQGLAAVFTSRSGGAGCTLTASGGGPFPSVRLDIVAANGRVGCSSSKAPQVFDGDVHAGSSWLASGMAAPSTVVVWNVNDAVTGEPSVVVTAPVDGADGQPAGAIALFMHIGPSAAALAHDLAGSEQGRFTLVDEASGRVLSSSLGRPAALVGQRFPSHQARGEWKDLDGSQTLFSSHLVTGTSWRIYVGQPSAQVFAAARGSLWRGGSLGVIAFFLLGVALLVLNRRVAKPLHALTAAVVTAAGDPGSIRIAPAGTTELVTLANEVNTLLDVRAGHEAQLLHQATHDPLTGLPNNALFRDRLEQALSRNGERPELAVLALGIDRFRTLNDALGPDAADRVLIELAGRLAAVLEPGDTLARAGGDQFLVLTEGIHDAEAAAQLTARLQSCMQDAFHPFSEPVTVACSVGVALSAGQNIRPSAPQLLREADSAMHQAKVSGQGWALADQAQQMRATQHLQTEAALHEAIEEGQLVVHYQPLLDIATGRLAGAEALVRWLHPDRGLVPPMEFIPVAEETGQIVAIGAFVLHEACAEAARWIAARHPITMSVNVAVGQLREPGFIASVQHALATAGLPPERLCLELTESAMMRASSTETKALEALRQLGVRLAIDDFGTGYSSLAYLHQLPVDELKIDRSFINRIAAGNRDAHLVEAIMGMAHALGLDVVAEGIETAEQLEFLAELGCQQGQGYLFSQPVPPATLHQRFAGSDHLKLASTPGTTARVR
jgi:diguanylate cyclase (GGDEF)-like protein